MTRNNQEMGPSRELGYAILFFDLMFAYAVLAYKEFSNGEMKFGGAITALALLMAGTGTFCLRSLLTHRRAERGKKQREEEK